jgi:ferredoxin-NADP reductase
MPPNTSFFKAKVIAKTGLAWKTTQLDLESLDKTFSFIPGQFVNIKINETAFRPYSISSNPKNLPQFSLVIETGHKGLGSTYIKSLNPNDEITLTGPSGKLALKNPQESNLHFFATGTGIAPFISISYILIDQNYSGTVNLYFGVRKEEELFYRDRLENLKKQLKLFNYTVFFSQPQNPKNKPQRITAVLPKINIASSQFYVCGHPGMVAEVFTILVNKGVPQKNIITEEFTRPKQTGKV